MVRYFTSLFVLLVFLLFYLSFTNTQSEPLAAAAPEPEPEEWVMDEALALYLQEFEQNFAQGLHDEGIPGAAVAIVKNGRVVFQKGFGVKEAGTPAKVDENTVFRLGSVSKGFAAVLTGMFVEEGLLGWNDSVSGFLNSFMLHDAEQTRRVQIRHLLSHTTGLPRHAYTNLIEDGLSLDLIIPRLQQVPLISKEGAQLSYQNATYSVIEKILEVQANASFHTLLAERLLLPLGMDHSSANYNGIHYSENKALPHLRYSGSKKRVPVAISQKYYNAVSSGGVNASASDMGKYLLLLTGHYPDIISEETLKEIYDPMVTIRNRRHSRYWDGVNESQYGMGWRMLDNHGQKIVYHGGYVNGYRSEIAFSPEDGVGICILINTNSNYALTVIPDFFNHFPGPQEMVLE